MTKNKHDHTATKKIKAWLFAIMLLLPFLFLLPTGLYYGLNQNAQLSERTEQTPIYYQTNEVNNADDLLVDNIYFWNDNFSMEAPNTTIPLLDLIYTENLTQELNIPSNAESIYLYISSAGNLAIRYAVGGVNQFTNSLNNKTFNFVIYSKYSNLPNDFIQKVSASQMLIIKEYVDITYNNDISTSIINAWNSTWENPLFSWTSYSPFYAPMQSFTNVFGINNMQIANILTYLATITAIYIVFDIVIELFTYLTHLIPRSD